MHWARDCESKPPEFIDVLQSLAFYARAVRLLLTVIPAPDHHLCSAGCIPEDKFYTKLNEVSPAGPIQPLAIPVSLK